MKKVKASRTGTPAAEFLVFSMAYMKPKAPPRKTISPKPPRQGLRDARGNAQPGAQHRGHHAQREQPVGIAQHFAIAKVALHLCCSLQIIESVSEILG
jgi:hypothetical protein